MATTKQQLRQEAAAWRKLAEWYATGTGWICWNTGGWSGMVVVRDDCWTAPFRGPWRTMHERVSEHAEMGEEFFPARHGLAYASDRNSNPRVMFCLWLALECEEEARA